MSEINPNGQAEPPHFEPEPTKKPQVRRKPTKPRSDAGKASKVAKSPHSFEYDRLLRAGWSNRLVSRYAAHRYAEDISSTAFWRYRVQKGIDEPTSMFADIEADNPVDVLIAREQLIRLQAVRIAIDRKAEEEAQKLIGTTRQEITCLSGLLNEHKADLQDLGLFPKAGEKVEVSMPSPEVDAPGHESLADLFATDPAAEFELARVLHIADRRGEETG